MTAAGILSWLIIGGVVGALGRLVVPGRPPIPIWLTIVVGTVAAAAGSAVSSMLGLSSTSGIDWMAVILQIVLAAIGVATAANLYTRRVRRSFDYTSLSGPTPLPADRTPGAPSRSRGATPVQQVRNTPGGTAAQPDFRPRQPAASTAQPEQVVSPRVSPAPLPRPPSRVFVSYRRADTWPVARLMVDRLRADFTHDDVFMDVDSIERGVDFVEAVRAAIRASAVVLVLIGSEWIAAEDGSGRRRLDDPADNVRMEIEYALGLNKVVMPVLVNDVVMPHSEQVPDRLRPLLRLNALHVRHLSWDRDIEELVRDVRRRRP